MLVRQYKDIEFSELVGKTISEITGLEVGKDEIIFTCDDGKKYLMYHRQDCCEAVSINEIHGDVNDLIGTPILKAECSTNSGYSLYNDDYTKKIGYDSEDNEIVDVPEGSDDSWSWTFYRLTTIKGPVQIKWFGTSNGYYSERVDFVELREIEQEGYDYNEADYEGGWHRL